MNTNRFVDVVRLLGERPADHTRATAIVNVARECPAIDMASQVRSRRVIGVLARLTSVRGAQSILRLTNGPVFGTHGTLDWPGRADIDTAPTGAANAS